MIDEDPRVAFALVARYTELRPKVAALAYNIAGRLKRESAQPAGPVSLALTVEALRETRRVVSREPGGAALRQLAPRPGDSYARLHEIIEEAAFALDAFHRRYYRTFANDLEGEWWIDPATEP